MGDHRRRDGLRGSDVEVDGGFLCERGRERVVRRGERERKLCWRREEREMRIDLEFWKKN